MTEDTTTPEPAEPEDTDQTPAYVIYTDQSVRDHHGVALIQVTPELIARLQAERLDDAVEGEPGSLSLWATYADVKRLIEATGATVLEFRNPTAAGATL